MKLFNNIALLLFSSVLLSFTTYSLNEEEIKYEIIAQGSSSQLQGYITIDNIFEYDDFWMHLTGTLSGKPYVDMDRSRLIVLRGTSTINKITATSESINIYTTTIVHPASPYIIEPNNRIPFRIIRINYNSSPLKWFNQDIEEEIQTD